VSYNPPPKWNVLIFSTINSELLTVCGLHFILEGWGWGGAKKVIWSETVGNSEN